MSTAIPSPCLEILFVWEINLKLKQDELLSRIFGNKFVNDHFSLMNIAFLVLAQNQKIAQKKSFVNINQASKPL